MTDRSSSESLESLLGATLHQLRVDLDGHHQVVDLSERGEQRVRSAIEWLLAVRNEEGYWGYRSPAVTAVCVIGIALWRPVEAEALLRGSAEWLLRKADDGVWETIWDTGAAVTAVHAAGVGDDPGARAAMRRLTDQRWCRQMDRDLDLAAGAYVVGQAVYGLLEAGRPVGELGEPLEHLADYLTQTPMSTAAFLHHAAALRALARAGTHPDVVDRTIDDFFGPAYRRDGSWYHEPWYTAWALLALHEAKAVRRVVVEQPRLDEYLARVDRELAAAAALEVEHRTEERRARLTVAGATAALLGGLLGAGLAVFAMPETNRLFTSGAAVAIVTPAVALAGRRLWQLLRPSCTVH